VFVGGLAAPLLYAGPTQINFQVPFETNSGTAAITVANNFVKSFSYASSIALAAPQIFTWGSDRAVAQNADFSLNSPDNPAHAGDTLVVYGTGEGQVSPPALTGDAAPLSPPATLSLDVTATIGGQNVPVAFAGLAPGLVGLFQVNLAVPSLKSGDYPIQVSVGSVRSNSPLVSIR
jgi:uncharacterized protein (TIGR03437 family)